MSKKKKKHEKKLKKQRSTSLEDLAIAIQPGGILYKAFNFLVDIGVVDELVDALDLIDDEVVIFDTQRIPLDVLDNVTYIDTEMYFHAAASNLLYRLKTPSDLSRRDNIISLITTKFVGAGYQPVFFNGLIKPFENSSVTIELFFTEQNNGIHGLAIDSFYITVNGFKESIAIGHVHNFKEQPGDLEGAIDKLLTVVRKVSDPEMTSLSEIFVSEDSEEEVD